MKKRITYILEDGTTPLHRAFDAAALDAVENGCDGIEHG
jgi:hypothetical protein